MLNYCIVKQRIGAIAEDDPNDNDRYPNYRTVSGDVTFTPILPQGKSYQIVDSEGITYTAPALRITAKIVNGEITHEGEPGVHLFAAGDNSNPPTIAYNVIYSNLNAGGIPVTLSGISFVAIPGATIDLSSVTPITGTPGLGITKGDKGDPFTFDDFTPEQLADINSGLIDELLETTINTVDGQTANLISQPDTLIRQALDTLFTRSMLVDANTHGVVADGVTDDRPAWQALVNSLEGTGATITWTGRSVLDASILWKRGVNLVGQGWGQSVLATRGTGTPFGAVEGFTPYVSATNPYLDLTFANFEVDGSEQATIHPGPSISGKALFIQFMRRCQILNLYLHDTIGTALGIDFLPDCLIHGVVVVRGGKNWTGSEGGHAGIGIGMGAWEEENTTISDCHTIDCGHWGIFVERQNEQPYRARGAKIVNCSATGTRGTGIADVGCTDTLIMGCSSTNNGLATDGRWRDGFQAMYGSIGTRFINNISSYNVGDGFNIRSDNGPTIVLSGNRATYNNRRGITVSAEGKTLVDYTLRDNELAYNRFDGIAVGSTTAGSLPNLIVSGNRSYNNGQAGQAGADRGINIGANVTGGMIDRNRCYDSQETKTQRYGIGLPSGVITDTTMVGNNLVGNDTAAMTTTGATLTKVVRRNNIGYTTENRGTGLIPGAQTTATILHGLSTAPSSVQVTSRNGQSVWVTTIGASGFIVNRETALQDSGVEFTWTAEV